MSRLKGVIVAAMVQALVSWLPIGRRQRDLSLLLAIAGDGRRRRPLAVLGPCAGRHAGDLSTLARRYRLQLSFLGTTGILLLADPLARRIPGPEILVDPLG